MDHCVIVSYVRSVGGYASHHVDGNAADAPLWRQVFLELLPDQPDPEKWIQAATKSRARYQSHAPCLVLAVSRSAARCEVASTVSATTVCELAIVVQKLAAVVLQAVVELVSVVVLAAAAYEFWQLSPSPSSVSAFPSKPGIWLCSCSECLLPHS